MPLYILGMRCMRNIGLTACLSLLPIMVQSHPHVFIDTTLRIVIADDGALEGVEVTWVYDDFYSLLLLTDMGLDPDGDGVLEEGELRRLNGFDLQWIEGFEGDTYVETATGTSVSLGPPEARGIAVENGRIISTHFRAASAQADGLVVKAYDPGFYTAYTLVQAATVNGPCITTVTPANLDAAYSRLEELLFGMPQEEAEAYFPEVGESFADTVFLTCSSG